MTEDEEEHEAYEEEDIDVEVEISGTYCRIEHYFEDVYAINIKDGEFIELTDKELDKAQEILFDKKCSGE